MTTDNVGAEWGTLTDNETEQPRGKRKALTVRLQ